MAFISSSTTALPELPAHPQRVYLHHQGAQDVHGAQFSHRFRNSLLLPISKYKILEPPLIISRIGRLSDIVGTVPPVNGP